jgi:hypothetical protein
MAEGGLNISQGIGSGEAQIVRDFQSPISAQAYGQVYGQMEQRKQQQAAAQKKAQEVPEYKFTGRLNDAKHILDYYNNEVLGYVRDHVNDPDFQVEKQKRISNLYAMTNFSTEARDLAETKHKEVMEGGLKNYYPNAETGFVDGLGDIPEDVWKSGDMTKLTQAYGNIHNKLNSITGVPIIDFSKEINEVQGFVSGWAKDNQQGKKWKAPDNVVNGFIEEKLANPLILGNLAEKMKADPMGAAAANNDPYTYGYNLFKGRIKAEGYNPESKGTTVNITNQPEENTLGVGKIFKNQSFVIGDKDQKGQFEYVMDGFSVSPKETVTAVPANSWNMTTLDRPTQTGGITLKNGQLSRGRVTTRAITIPQGYGKFSGLVYPAGMPVPQKSADAALQPILDFLNKSKDVGYGSFFMGQDASNDEWIAMPSDVGMGAVESGLTKQGADIFYSRADELNNLGGKQTAPQTATPKGQKEVKVGGLKGNKR